MPLINLWGIGIIFMYTASWENFNEEGIKFMVVEIIVWIMINGDDVDFFFCQVACKVAVSCFWFSHN